MILSSYLRRLLHPAALQETVADIKAAILKTELDFDVIACRGMSGAIVASILSVELNKPLVIVRKNEGHHSQMSFEGEVSFTTYIIVDDFIETGNTINTIIGQINKLGIAYTKEYKCLGIFLWGVCPGPYKIEFDVPCFECTK